MHLFSRSEGRLQCEGADLELLARRFGTPVYVYSAGTIEKAYRRLAAALAPLEATICYAVKANGHLAILRLLADLGASFDIVSGGELERLQAAGIAGGRAVFAGVGKSGDEIRAALEAGVLALHVESLPELRRVAAVAARLGVRAPVALRLNPDVDARTHEKITTGRAENKFGLPRHELGRAFAEAAALAELIEVVGVQMHLGSQIRTPEPFTTAIARLAESLAEAGRPAGLRYLSIGGGLPVVYEDALASGQAAWWETRGSGERPMTVEEFAAAVVPALQPLGLRVLVEPGRYLVAPAGALLTGVEYVKEGVERRFVICDAGMNDLVRPAMYDAHHDIEPAVAREGDAVPVDVVGPVCETGDTFARSRVLPPVEAGDVLAILTAGAYGTVMASRYNGRPLPPEVLVRGTQVELISRRDTVAEAIGRERLPAAMVAAMVAAPGAAAKAGGAAVAAPGVATRA